MGQTFFRTEFASPCGVPPVAHRTSAVRSDSLALVANDPCTYPQSCIRKDLRGITRRAGEEKASFLKENILPIKESGQLEFVQHPYEKEMSKGGWTVYPPPYYEGKFNERISVLFVSGHTSNMMLPKISYKDRTIVFMADLIPSQGHIPLPYIMAYDMFPLTTLEEKKSFLSEAVSNNYILFFEHDPVNECCDLQMTEKGIRMGRSFGLSEMT